jgi:superfamily II DNA/RNA helicase
VSDVDPPFSDFEISQRTLDALASQGINTAFPIQALTLADALAGRDVLAQAPTGSGKTLAFAIPIVERLQPKTGRPAALVLVPTRELCTQVVEEFRVLTDGSGFRVMPVYGGTKVKQQSDEAARADIIIATPGRLNDIVNRRMLDISGVREFVLDEADRMLDMGFQPQVDRIVRQLPEERRTMFFSATLESAVGRMALRYTKDPVTYSVARSATDNTGTIEHRFVKTTRGSKLKELVTLLEDDEHVPGGTLVFVRTKGSAHAFGRELKEWGISAAALHGDMPQNIRERELKKFSDGKVRILAATDVAARGLDLDDITHVIQFDCPEDEVTYVHRVGRTGRAGRVGRATTLVQIDQQGSMGRIARALKLEDEYQAGGLRIGPPESSISGRSKYATPGRKRWR